MNQICSKYCELIEHKFKSEIDSIIIYGSNIYNPSASDLDICLITNSCSKMTRDDIIKETLLFHKMYGLKIDNEIPHTNKLVYTWNEIEDAIKNPPFYKKGKAIIKDIVKTKKFLSSKEMKKRLILNILTTDHLTIGKTTIEYEKKSFQLIIDAIIDYFNLINPNYLDILNCMYKNKFTGAEGEMYLGYKQTYLEKEEYLIKRIKEYLSND